MACGSGDDDSTATPVANASLNTDAEQQFRELTGKWGNASARITYTLTNAAGDAQVVVSRRDSRSRIDHTIAGRTSTVIVREDGGYTCLNATNSCGALSTADASAAASSFIPFVVPLADTAGVNAIVAGAESMELVEGSEIAGAEATCIKADGNLGDISGPTTFCFSEDGLLLRIKYEGFVPFDMTASAIEDAEESDFDPPYAVPTVPPSPSS
jgi:hypothetical protein